MTRKWGSKRGKELRVQGAALYEELVREKPGDQELRVALAKSLIEVAEIHWVEKEYQAGWSAAVGRSTFGSNCGPPSPTTLSSGVPWAGATAMRALLKRDTDDSEGQNTDIRRAVEIFQEMLKNAPNDEATMGRLATACRRATRLDLLLEGVRISRQLEKSGKK